MAVVYYFDELLLDPNVVKEAGAVGSPEFANTHIRNPATGIYKRNVTRYDPKHVWDLNMTLLTAAQLDYVLEFWNGGHGSAYGFRAVIYADFYVIDEVIGTGDGVTTIFPLYRTYKRPGANHTYTRRIIKPVVNALVSPAQALYEADGVTSRAIPSNRAAALGVPAFTVKKDNVTTTAYTVNNTTGKITFTVAPANGVVISWSGEYDTPCCFMQNSFQMKPGIPNDIQGLQLVELLAPELGIT